MLKKIICTVSLIILAAAPAFAKPADINNLPQAEFLWHRGPDKSWEVNFNDAVSKAKEQNKKVFMLATGSDWCPPCKMLKTKVLSNPEFKQFADKKFVYLWLDSPRQARLPDNQIIHNHIVKNNFPFGNGVPSVVIIDPASKKVIGKISGYKPLDAYINTLKQYVK